MWDVMKGGAMDRREMQDRTKQFALRALKLADALSNTASGRAVAGQFARCGSAVGANYRAAGRARSRKEFLARLGVVEEEADECAFWLEVIVENALLPPKRVKPLLDEAEQILRIMVASINTTKRRSQP